MNHQLFCESVSDEIRLGMEEDNEEDIPRVLSELGLLGTIDRHSMSLSGGQKQRVAIASAVLAGKEILILDEPTNGLDFRHMEQTAELLSSLRGKKTIFVITHDPELIIRCRTHVIHMKNGSIYVEYSMNGEGVGKRMDYFKLDRTGVDL